MARHSPRTKTARRVRRPRKPDCQALSRFAQVDGVEKVMRPYFEAMLRAAAISALLSPRLQTKPGRKDDRCKVCLASMI
jgi:hypothetical protein